MIKGLRKAAITILIVIGGVIGACLVGLLEVVVWTFLVVDTYHNYSLAILIATAAALFVLCPPVYGIIALTVFILLAIRHYGRRCLKCGSRRTRKEFVMADIGQDYEPSYTKSTCRKCGDVAILE